MVTKVLVGVGEDIGVRVVVAVTSGATEEVPAALVGAAGSESDPANELIEGGAAAVVEGVVRRVAAELEAVGSLES